jgi:hypothetical protein
MRKLEIAEAILSLAADRDRAAAIAGDLLEESRGSAPRFWWLVVQTTLLQTGRQSSSAPLGMLAAAMRALLIELGIILVSFIVPGIVGVVNVVHSLFLPDGPALTAWSWIIGTLIVPFLLGRWMARRYPGHEGSAIASLGFLHAILRVCTSVLEWKAGFPIRVDLAWFVLFEPTSILVTAAGAAFARYKTLRGVAHE